MTAIFLIVLFAFFSLGPAAVVTRIITTPPRAKPRHHKTGPPEGRQPGPTRTYHAPQGDHLWHD